jgi:hypothetical protein
LAPAYRSQNGGFPRNQADVPTVPIENAIEGAVAREAAILAQVERFIADGEATWIEPAAEREALPPARVDGDVARLLDEVARAPTSSATPS